MRSRRRSRVLQAGEPNPCPEPKLHPGPLQRFGGLGLRTGTKDGRCGADPMDPCEDESVCLDVHAHAFLVGSASQLAPDFSQAAQPRVLVASCAFCSKPELHDYQIRGMAPRRRAVPRDRRLRCHRSHRRPGTHRLEDLPARPGPSNRATPPSPRR